MTRRKGNMWSAFKDADIMMVTTNSYVRNDGSLVMGAGAAKQARDRFSNLAQNLGSLIEDGPGHLGRYGTIFPTEDIPVGAFQVKTHWKQDASTELIECGVNMLGRYAEFHPKADIHLNYPGIGNGGLDKSDVEPIVALWPDNVHVWTYE